MCTKKLSWKHGDASTRVRKVVRRAWDRCTENLFARSPCRTWRPMGGVYMTFSLVTRTCRGRYMEHASEERQFYKCQKTALLNTPAIRVISAILGESNATQIAITISRYKFRSHYAQKGKREHPKWRADQSSQRSALAARLLATLQISPASFLRPSSSSSLAAHHNQIITRCQFR